jgi:hypothetical protein
MRDASFAGDISGHGQYGKVAARPGRTTLCLPTLGLRSYSAFIPESQIFALDLLVKGIASDQRFRLNRWNNWNVWNDWNGAETI